MDLTFLIGIKRI